ncbi:MAG TPA: hypothetical protein VG406_21130 [Isosphaeraceae bacterium]|jgi:hypothetical protein|nr:hypothetical protein [Isosphaeraceae bacterium]
MRLPRPSFRLRTLMVLVALAALGMGGYAQYRRLRRLSQQYRARASVHAQRERFFASRIVLGEKYITEGGLLLAYEERRRGEETDDRGRQYHESQKGVTRRPLPWTSFADKELWR